jgi:anti-sigma factor ChrR (cupin superfamily)
MSAKLIVNLMNIVSEQQQIKWQPYSENGRHNVEIFPLYSDKNEKNEGPAAALMKYKPGAYVTRHTHLGYELIFVLEGELVNDTGIHKAGTLEICPPGSHHSLSSEKGCVFLVVWEQPVRVEESIDEALHA